LKTPVAFLIFNRPEATRRVFDEIARAQPRRLLVVADGPRSAEESEKCAEARAVLQLIDWDCELLTNFSDVNLGCKRRVASGLDWVFEICEEAIILEDDCLPDPTFFPFCEELLEKYRHDDRVAMICGNNFQRGRRRSQYSYYFSRHVTAWGWASWRRVWRYYDVKMSLWPAVRETNWLESLLVNPVAVEYWRGVFDMMYEGATERANTWDYQFFFSWWVRHALAVTPEVNLITNLGFNPDATHTHDAQALKTMAALPSAPIDIRRTHPPYMHFDREADNFAFRQICPWIVDNQSLYWRLRHRFASAWPRPLRQSIRHLRDVITAAR
jgi:hypothetical protein